ncbi:fadA, partial [Symbiodinium sp. KB8]
CVVSARKIASYLSGLPVGDDHRYRTGAWTPNTNEWTALDCHVDGELPSDLDGVYIRNTENPLHDSIGRYHPFDGDAMVHAMEIGDGVANYRNRFVRTIGFEAELAAGGPLWAGLAEPPTRSIDERGWGARTRMKDASSTDVVVHAGHALTSFYQCGDLYAMDPVTLEQLGPVDWGGRFPADGVSAHTKLDEHTGEMMFFNYSVEAPYMHYGVVDAAGELAHYTPIELPGARLPHDMVFTENYAILNDCPMFWDPDVRERGLYAVRFYPELPTRLGVVPRRGGNDEIRWFDFDPTFVLHWINAYEDGDEIVVDGFFQRDPSPTAPPNASMEDRMFRYLDNSLMQPIPYRWRMNMVTGAVSEGPLSDLVSEFGMINPNYAGRPYQYVWSATNKPGWFLFDGIRRTDVETGEVQNYTLDDGVYLSEAPVAPKAGATAASAEDDAYVITYTIDMNNDRSECLVFDATDITTGPIARIALPERISSRRMNDDVFFCDAIRSPRAKASPRGGLAAHTPLEVLTALHEELRERSGLPADAPDDVIIGCASQNDAQGANIAKTSAILAGWADSVPGTTVNRFCASGVEAINAATARIKSGDADLVLAGGIESVSHVPMFSDNGPLFCDDDVVARIGSIHMGIAADVVATMEGFEREQLDEYGARTQQKAEAAWNEGRFGASVLPFDRADGSAFATDEHVRNGTTVESLRDLEPAFAELGASGQDELVLHHRPELGEVRHLHTRGTSPSLADAGALVVLASAAAVDKYGLTPRARVVGGAATSVDAVTMLTAGQLSVERLLDRFGLTPDDVDLYEFAEAFGALCLRFQRDLGVGDDRFNPNGGTIAMGHAFGATGTILAMGIVEELERRGGTRGIATVSGAAGLGVATLLERVA